MGFHVFYIFIRCLGQQPGTPLNFVIGLLFLHTSFSSVPFPNLYEVETSHKVRYLSTYRYIPTTQTPLCSDNLNQYFVFAILRKTVRLEETTPDSNLVHKCTGNLSLCSPTEEFKPFGHFRNRKKKVPMVTGFTEGNGERLLLTVSTSLSLYFYINHRSVPTSGSHLFSQICGRVHGLHNILIHQVVFEF